VAMDITELRRAEEAQKRSETRYGFMVDNVPFAIISYDPRYTILEWNRGAERIFGWSREEAVGKNDFELLIPEKNMEEMKQLLGSYTEGSAEVKANINQNLRRDGTSLPAAGRMLLFVILKVEWIVYYPRPLMLPGRYGWRSSSNNRRSSSL